MALASTHFVKASVATIMNTFQIDIIGQILKNDIIKWIHECQGLNLCKSESYIPKAELYPIKCTEPFSRSHIDFTGPLPIIKRGNKYIRFFTSEVRKNFIMC
ncbi:hypothetical protein RF11_14267 [Thelohanellus kitauei]|uniref:Uncharacterized protein n=1 Tax=Thelohanellus kitauei TaxID=669202 RepID=A0A0C2J992_THEKT|nr:hypothetical protein RF11_14267 [Thelohanellus kitauei]